MRIISLFLIFLSNISFAKEIEIAVASMMHNLENESSIIFGDHVRKGIYLSLIHNKKLLDKLGLEIKLTEYNYTSETASILEVAKKIQKSNAIAVHGYDYSSHALLSQHIHKDKDLSVVLPTATSDDIKENANNYFQIAGSNKSQAYAILELLKKRNITKASLIKRRSCAYCVDLSNQIETLAKEYNVKLDIILANNPKELKQSENVYNLLPMYESEAIDFIKAISRDGKPRVYIGGDGWTSKGERYFKLLNDYNFKAICLAHWNQNTKDKSSKLFKQDYKSYFGSEASDVSALSYDSINFILSALPHLKSYDRSSLKNYFSKRRTFLGITGKHDFKENRKKGFVYLTWKQNSFKVLDEI